MFNSPEALLANLGVAELFERRFGRDAAMLDAAHVHYRESLARHEKPPRDEDALRAVSGRAPRR